MDLSYLETPEYKEALDYALNNARIIEAANQLIKVKGERRMLPLEGRDIEIVYYSSPEPYSPLIVGYHGGGFVYGGCALDDTMWPEIAKALCVNIASVGYRKSPDHLWGDCLDDAYDSVIYLRDHADEFGFDPEHISVMGQSAGGNLAAEVSILAAERGNLKLDNEILIYPFINIDTDPVLRNGLPYKTMRSHVMADIHCPHNERQNPYVSPVYATDDMLKGLPHTIIVLSGHDLLTRESREYVRRLREQGNTVSDICFEDMPHAYFECGFKRRLSAIENEFLGEDAGRITADGSMKQATLDTIEYLKKEFRR